MIVNVLIADKMSELAEQCLHNCGTIGSIVADRAQGFKVRVIAYDPFLSIERAQDLGVEKVELNVLFQRAVIISLHTPLT